MSDSDKIFEVFLKEYDKLKSEQSQRIGFRDNLLYVTLLLVSSIVSFSVYKGSNYYALLIIPWVCLILGWTYVVNDQKISAIGSYIRQELLTKVMQHLGYEEHEYTSPKGLKLFFGWEKFHRVDSRRWQRKFEQLIVDEITFVVSGLIALRAFWFLVPNAPTPFAILSWAELILLIVLGVEICVYADLGKGCQRDSKT